MSYSKKIFDLANTFQVKYGQQVNQLGTTELFFENEEKQKAFAQAIQDPSGVVYKLLLSIFNKTNNTVSFDLKASATPGQGASWILSVEPSNLKSNVSNVLNNVYQKIMGKSMLAVLQSANTAAKQGAGSGINDIGALELNP